MKDAPWVAVPFSEIKARTANIGLFYSLKLD